MIVVSAGMQKAASGSLFNLTNDLLVASGFEDVHNLRRGWRWGGFMTEVNCNIGPLRAYKLLWLCVPHWLGQTFVVKTHEAPSPTSKLLCRMNAILPCYIYRDPRDVAVSLFDHGERLRQARAKSRTHFDELTTMEAAIRFAADRLSIWRAWRNIPDAILVRFEELVHSPEAVASRLLERIGLALDDSLVEAISAKYRVPEDNSSDAPERIHYHKGKPGRWARRLSADQLAMCRNLFGDSLTEMGYSWDYTGAS